MGILALSFVISSGRNGSFDVACLLSYYTTCVYLHPLVSFGHGLVIFSGYQKQLLFYITC